MSASNPGGQGAALEAAILQFERWLGTRPWRGMTALWRAQTRRMQLALAFTALFVLASVMNLCGSVGRSSVSQVIIPVGATARAVAVVPPSLLAEAAPPDAGKSWMTTKVWQGSDSRDTEELTMSGHWRVDWIFSPARGGGSLHVFIYSVEPRTLLYEAAGTQISGADSSFWTGNGRFFLKINADRGDWKVAVQELR
jgi:hypothetical protein